MKKKFCLIKKKGRKKRLKRSGQETASEKRWDHVMETKGEKRSSFIHPFNINLLTIQGVLERISRSKVVEILRRRSFGTRKAVLAYLKEQGQVEQHKVPFGQRAKVVKSE